MAKNNIRLLAISAICAVVIASFVCRCIWHDGGDSVEPTRRKTETFMDRLNSLAVSIEGNKLDTGFPSWSYQEVKEMTACVNSMPLLWNMFYECLREEQGYRARELSRAKRVAYRNGQFAVLSRLAEIGTPESTKLLVDIFLDKAVTYEGREADMFGFLITVCGEKAVPFLEEVGNAGDRREMIGNLLRCIKSGRLYPFMESVDSTPEQITPYAFIHYIKDMCLRVPDGKTNADVYYRVSDDLDAKVKTMNSVPFLKELFYSTYTAGELLLWCNIPESDLVEPRQTPLCYAQDAVLARLVEIKTDQSARLLVDILFKDTSVRIVGYRADVAEFLVRAMSQCGDLCLPYLEQIEDDHPRKNFARAVIERIKEANP